MVKEEQQGHYEIIFQADFERNLVFRLGGNFRTPWPRSPGPKYSLQQWNRGKIASPPESCQIASIRGVQFKVRQVSSRHFGFWHPIALPILISPAGSQSQHFGDIPFQPPSPGNFEAILNHRTMGTFNFSRTNG
jgi:hypothetical protein